MNILICDDIKDEVIKLEKSVKSAFLQIAGYEANIRSFNKGGDVLSFIHSGARGMDCGAKIDVCFLDIIMPEMDGIELAQKMTENGFNGKIIFISSSNEYGPDSYKVKAFSYLLKSYNQKDIENVLQEILELKKSEDKAGFFVTTRNIKKYLYFHEISYIEVMRNSVYFHFLNRQDISITAALSDVLPQLDGRFAQCHRSFVVNMDAVAHIHGKEVFLRCGRKAPIARNNKDFDDQYFMRVMGKGM